MATRTTAALGVLALLAAAGAARAAGTDLEFYSGDDLYAQCSATPSDADYQPRSARCLGYVIGVSDALQAEQGAGRAGVVCILPATQATQLADAVRSYLDAHPDKRRVAAPDQVVAALTAAFPCR